jgi:hypothetical protein
MTGAAMKLERDVACLEKATVQSVKHQVVEVALAGCSVGARRAASCLLAPEAGDRVLIAWTGDECWVLAVLEREPNRTAWLESDGDLGIRVGAGRLTLAAQEGVDVATPGETSVTTGRFNVNAVEANMVIRGLRLLGASVEAKLEKLSTTAEKVETVAERIHERAKRYYRFVQEFDQLRAGHMDYRAEKYARIHATDTVMTANQLVKIDGSQVHIG